MLTKALDTILFRSGMKRNIVLSINKIGQMMSSKDSVVRDNLESDSQSSSASSTSSNDNQRQRNRNDNLVVCVEGNIGCGKTTLLEYFKTASGCEILAEPVEKWRNVKGFNALELMYQDPVRWGMALQTHVQLTMLQNHSKPMTEPVKLMERSIFSAKYCFTDNLFHSGKMPAIEHAILTEWFDWIIQSQNIKVDLFVYLRTDPELLYSRIKQRCRPEEEGIPLDYLRTLHQLHEEWLIHKKSPCPAEVLVIDANSSLEEMQIAYEFHKSKILQRN
ncbi:thymidine kinase 2, mitochondrial [Aplysia californica]|uniref:Thymidine kinase 2, mitochondrial n=1 Tax=Aplysia californica TaxID=6500 RepID=A0ABM0JGL6_APLCA|nr:thymidine kinase 2, mitochondrial [Aplysia californica]